MSRRFVVTGGAGFLGSHLCEVLHRRGEEVVAVDDLSSGRLANLAALLDQPRFSFVHADVCDGIPVEGAVDVVAHLASPASPPRYMARPLETLRVGSRGTDQALALATERGARFFLASTSEVYGDPHEHPQSESYWGNVNPIGPRSVYDEAKRFAEALAFAYHRHHGTDIAVVRIFNTYGPRLDPADGRVVSNFITQALTGRPLTVYGEGKQTRSFCYVDDEVRGLLALIDSDLTGPVNIGNPDEFTMLELADLVLELTGSSSPLEHEPAWTDDPAQRQPDISLARSALGWEPATDLRQGLERTIDWFRSELG